MPPRRTWESQKHVKQIADLRQLKTMRQNYFNEMPGILYKGRKEKFRKFMGNVVAEDA